MAPACVSRAFRVMGRPSLILSHGNGFAIDGYAAFWSLLLKTSNWSSSTFAITDNLALRLSMRTRLRRWRTIMSRWPPRPASRLGRARRSAFSIPYLRDCRNARRSRQSVWDAAILVDPPLVSLDPASGLVRSADSRLAQVHSRKALALCVRRSLRHGHRDGVRTPLGAGLRAGYGASCDANGPGWGRQTHLSE